MPQSAREPGLPPCPQLCLCTGRVPCLILMSVRCRQTHCGAQGPAERQGISRKERERANSEIEQRKHAKHEKRWEHKILNVRGLRIHSCRMWKQERALLDRKHWQKNLQIFKYSGGKAPVMNYFVFFSFNIWYIPQYSFVGLSNYVKCGFSTTTVTFIWPKVCVYLLTF